MKINSTVRMRRLCAVLLLMSAAASLSAAVFSLHEVRAQTDFQAASIGSDGRFLRLFAGADAYLFSVEIAAELPELSEITLPKELSLRGGILVPNAGIRIGASRKAVQPFIKGLVYMVVPVIQFESDLNFAGIDQQRIQEYLDSIVESITVAGGSVSFGVEYRVNEHFGLSGEAGTKVSFNSADMSVDSLLPNSSIKLESLYGGPFTQLSVHFYW
jgi:hypothetical protein